MRGLQCAAPSLVRVQHPGRRRGREQLGSGTVDSRDPRHLLFIEPKTRGSSQPLIDSATRKMVAAYRMSAPGTVTPAPFRTRPGLVRDESGPFTSKEDAVLRSFLGIHVCICGARSRNYDFFLPNGMLTNSLCVHYLACHRAEVPLDQLATVEAFEYGEAEPSQEELATP